jgi:transcriptional regulator with XRE-family HTH domain
MKLVGQFVRQRRESLGLSQRALGQLFDPPVTTQFISNVERGVTPLPPAHIPTLVKALLVSEQELLSLLEREYAAKISGRVGKATVEAPGSGGLPQIVVSPEDYEFVRALYDAYRQSDEKTRQAFATVCETMLKLPRRPILAGGGGTPIHE